MCRMMAKLSSVEASAEYELLTASHSLSKQSLKAKLPFCERPFGPHDDGCGIAWVKDGRIQLKTRGRTDCWNASFIEHAEALSTSAFIAHNRAASAGLVINSSASHPYKGTVGGQEVAFCHNGGIKDLFGQASARRVTDSFLFLEHIESKVHVLDISALRNLLARCSRDWSYSSLNGLLLSTDAIYAWRCFEDRGSTGAAHEGYYTLHVHERPRDVCVASEALDRKRPWIPLPNRTLIELRRENGSVVMKSATF